MHVFTVLGIDDLVLFSRFYHYFCYLFAVKHMFRLASDVICFAAVRLVGDCKAV